MTEQSWLEALLPPGQQTWTSEENKVFEEALARYDGQTPDRWQRVADMLPGKTVSDVISHYQDLENDVSFIEAGLVPCPLYDYAQPFTLDWDAAGAPPGAVRSGKRGRSADHERKKGIPWTEDEHRLFLLGLKKYGRGDWRSISRNFVTTRTPTQVASHAQKYFIRLNSGSKDRRRSSIHDITTVNLPDDEHGASSPSAQQPGPVITGLPVSREPCSLFAESKPPRVAAAGVFKALELFTGQRQFSEPPSGVAPYGIKFQARESPAGSPPEDAMLLQMLQLQ